MYCSGNNKQVLTVLGEKADEALLSQCWRNICLYLFELLHFVMSTCN